MEGQRTSQRPRPKLPPGRRRYGLDIAECWSRARRAILSASGINPDLASRVVEPVARARRLAELAAPADMRLSLALGLGASPADLEADKAGARLMLEAAHKRLGIVGLRSGDSLEIGGSERFNDFLRAWFETAAPPPTPTPSPRVIEGSARALEPAPDPALRPPARTRP